MSPCKDCQARTASCHSTCEKYKKFREQRAAFLRARDIKRMSKIETTKSIVTLTKRMNHEVDILNQNTMQIGEKKK